MELRKMFKLPESDEFSLNNFSYRWETVKSGGSQRVIIYDYPIPPGYNIATVTLSLRIELNYPDSQIDMVYFSPSLVRTDNKAIKAVTTQNFDGKVWQQWSRHRTSKNPWRPGVDDISTHLLLVDHWLKSELKKG